MGTPLVIDESVRRQIKACIELAKANPVDMPKLMERIKNPTGKAHHMAQMTRQTIQIPMAYVATFSIERGHPCGECRHMSISVQRKGRIPNPVGVEMVAHEFGFCGSISEWTVWQEILEGHGCAINIVQPLLAKE